MTLATQWYRSGNIAFAMVDAEGAPSETDADIGKMSAALMEYLVMNDIVSVSTCNSSLGRFSKELLAKAQCELTSSNSCLDIVQSRAGYCADYASTIQLHNEQGISISH